MTWPKQGTFSSSTKAANKINTNFIKMAYQIIKEVKVSQEIDKISMQFFCTKKSAFVFKFFALKVSAHKKRAFICTFSAQKNSSWHQ